MKKIYNVVQAYTARQLLVLLKDEYITDKFRDKITKELKRRGVISSFEEDIRE